MGWMERMMEDMIKGLPVHEREAMLLKMMPEMMQQADMAKLMPNMLREMAGLVNLLLLYDLAQGLIENDDLRTQTSEAVSRLHATMPEMMEMMHPLMFEVMSTAMPKMMGFMSTMMPDMHEMMPQVMDEAMVPMISEKPEIKDHMLNMMQTMFPHCAMRMFPLIEKDKRNAFINRLYGIMARSATLEMDANEKKNFQMKSTEAVSKALNSNLSN